MWGSPWNVVKPLALDQFLGCVYASLVGKELKKPIGSGGQHISVGHNVFWSDKTYRGHTSITVDKLIEYIQFLINNIYVKVGNRVFKQTIGIPMGTDCAPLLANSFLRI